ncbi:MAG TPA: hypothetical protein VJQ82_26720 [Terriglobales bacterium]|nr:hypothetical protein [Terriglobales bacterium]
MISLSCNCEPIVLLSDLLLRVRASGDMGVSEDALRAVIEIPEGALSRTIQLAHKHHVVIRALEPLCSLMAVAGKEAYAARLTHVIRDERTRVRAAFSSLEKVCDELRAHGCPAVVMKSLDHWPDLGNDLDLFVDANPAEVVRLMRDHLGADIEPRSWGDRMAHKWNFALPDLRELVETHIGRLGQTGEHVRFGQSLLANARIETFDSSRFLVPAPEHRIILATLQRMYRHFYLRLCDVMNTAKLVESGSLDYRALEFSARDAGIWQGVASYLIIVSDYVRSFRGKELPLPAVVRAAACVRGGAISFRRDFLRIPILSQSVQLYFAEMRSFLHRRDLTGSLRLSLLPCLATAAVLGQKFTGSDKGVW